MISRTPGNRACAEGATVKNVALNSTTSTKILDASECRQFVSITNLNNAVGAYIKLQAADLDDDKKGIYLVGINTWEMDTTKVYTGEISAIAATDSPTFSITEY